MYPDILIDTNFLSQRLINLTPASLTELTRNFLGDYRFAHYFPSNYLSEVLKDPFVQEMLLLGRLGLNIDFEIADYYREQFEDNLLGEQPWFIYGAIRTELIRDYLKRAKQFGYPEAAMEFILTNQPGFMDLSKDKIRNVIREQTLRNHPSNYLDLSVLYEDIWDFMKDGVFLGIESAGGISDRMNRLFLTQGSNFPLVTEYFAKSIREFSNWDREKSFFGAYDAISAIMRAGINPFVISKLIEKFRNAGLLSSVDTESFLQRLPEEYQGLVLI